MTTEPVAAIEPILDTIYWHTRLTEATKRGEPHRAIYEAPLDTWNRYEQLHRKALATHVTTHAAVLDAGCAWGRLLNLLPAGYNGLYVGIDVSPDFIQMARHNYPGHVFINAGLRQALPYLPPGLFDWAVLISMRKMIIRNIGQQEWDFIETELHRVADRLLFLEFTEDEDHCTVE